MIILLTSALSTFAMVYSVHKVIKIWCHSLVILNVAIICFKMTPPTSIKLKSNWVDCQGLCNSDSVQIGNDSFKLVTYNVLGPLHGESSKHTYAPVTITKWTRRRDKLMEELRSLSADILCLQEVSYKSLKETFVPGLNRIGLQCTAFAPSKMAEKSRNSHGHQQIGCAIFTHQAKFSVLGTKTIYLRDFAGIDHSASQNFKYDVKGRHNSLALACLQLNSTKQIFIVANTHLFWDPNRADIKTIQTAALIRAVAHFNNVIIDCMKRNQTLTKSTDHNIIWPTEIPNSTLPVLLAGDFNTFLDIENNDGDSGFISTSLVELLTKGVLDKTHPQHPDSWAHQRNTVNSIDAWGNRNPVEVNPRLGYYMYIYTYTI